MKIGKYEIGLLYNGYAHYDLKERLGGDPFSALFPHLTEDSEEYAPMDLNRFDSMCLALSVMCTQYELQRRTEGYDHQDIPTLSYIKSHLKIRQIAEANIEIMAAINDGMQQENEPEEVDLGLLELQKKTEE